MPITPRHDRRTEAFQQAEADHDIRAQELELRANTEPMRQTQVLTIEAPLHRMAAAEYLHPGGTRTAKVA